MKHLKILFLFLFTFISVILLYSVNINATSWTGTELYTATNFSLTCSNDAMFTKGYTGFMNVSYNLTLCNFAFNNKTGYVVGYNYTANQTPSIRSNYWDGGYVLPKLQTLTANTNYNYANGVYYLYAPGTTTIISYKENNSINCNCF
jgi:hypothetical protein